MSRNVCQHRYFYLPLIVRRPGALMKLFASFLTFCFVYVWHGQQKTILIWSVLNFLGVTLEAAGKGMCEVAAYKRIEVSQGTSCKSLYSFLNLSFLPELQVATLVDQVD